MLRLLRMLLVGPFLTTPLMAEEEHRPWGTDMATQEKVEVLTKLRPSASSIMFEMGERYKNLYWAAEQGKWAFANYQREEMQKLAQTLIRAEPRFAEDAEEFLEHAFEALEPALAQRDLKRFHAAFEQMREQCMACHSANDHAFVLLPPKPPMGASPVLGQ